MRALPWVRSPMSRSGGEAFTTPALPLSRTVAWHLEDPSARTLRRLAPLDHSEEHHVGIGPLRIGSGGKTRHAQAWQEYHLHTSSKHKQ